ncbi:TPA: hypothetical protein ACMDSY_004500 [Vibrio parahaemolyticus]
MNLEKSWKITIKYLNAARRKLPEEMFFSEAKEAEKDFNEYLKHNELELAMNALDDMGILSNAPDEFWLDLELAASNMGLLADAERFNRIRNT